ncbi:MAG TPA: TlpA disulfide reductase family protein [Candidatus Dormibacteraeota bacterium]|nr:TlpA disulfide reductase family protein [Candidatus Dormibacteraeota bacterium]
MRRRAALRLGFLSCAALAVAGLAAGWGAPASAAATIPAPGEPVFDFALPDLQGNQVSLSSFRGRLVLVHFWATWCPVCLDEMAVLVEAARAHPDDLTVLGINLGEKPSKVSAYARRAGITFPILLDARGKVAARYGVLSLPITLVVGPDGRMAERVVMGSLDRDALGAILKRRLPG